jgi:hypothetical protein
MPPQEVFRPRTMRHTLKVKRSRPRNSPSGQESIFFHIHVLRGLNKCLLSLQQRSETVRMSRGKTAKLVSARFEYVVVTGLAATFKLRATTNQTILIPLSPFFLFSPSLLLHSTHVPPQPELPRNITIHIPSVAHCSRHRLGLLFSDQATLLFAIKPAAGMEIKK